MSWRGRKVAKRRKNHAPILAHGYSVWQLDALLLPDQWKWGRAVDGQLPYQEKGGSTRQRLSCLLSGATSAKYKCLVLSS